MAIKLRCWFFAVILWLGLLSPSSAAEMLTDQQGVHVSNRLGFGPHPEQIDSVRAMGIERYIQTQLAAESIPEPQFLIDRLAELETLSLSPMELYRRYDPGKPQQSRMMVAATSGPSDQLRSPLNQAQQARLLRAIYSPRQLQEVMVDFWYNHFNVSFRKGLDTIWVGAYEQQAIRPHALGKFRDLLGATARHPAMLYYLDNWRNTAPDSPGARPGSSGLNENYARELMELHTLGVEAGYTQADVLSLAKILTGWGICKFEQPENEDGFCFYPQRHNPGNKVFLGQSIAGGGIDEVERVLDLLASHPATAKHISYKLAEYFVHDQPPAALVDRLSKRFLATNGDIRLVLDTLFHSPEFWDQQALGAKFKTPYQYVISIIRASGLTAENSYALYPLVQRQGMPVYGCDSPDGYKNTREAWLNPDAMIRRIGLAAVLAQGKLPPTATDPSATPAPGQPLDPQGLSKTLGDLFSTRTKQALAASPADLRPALLLGSPEFMYR